MSFPGLSAASLAQAFGREGVLPARVGVERVRNSNKFGTLTHGPRGDDVTAGKTRSLFDLLLRK